MKNHSPRAERKSVVRLTETSQGLNLWGHTTSHSLKDVLGNGYFNECLSGRYGGLMRHDRIEVTASADGEKPEHATLVIAGTDPQGGVSVHVLNRTKK
ncbi:MAG: hypothetical protein IIC04_13175 [Proteobacteria bacterium]|nr:hypothetical protein [Pseudomonadota bacterium]